MLGAFEHEVLKEVGEATLIPLFILGTYVIPKIYRHKWKSRLVADDHIETIGQGFLGKAKTVKSVGIRHRVGWVWNRVGRGRSLVTSESPDK
jgi:hypothetical protein